jgi:hypothetical protein
MHSSQVYTSPSAPKESTFSRCGITERINTSNDTLSHFKHFKVFLCHLVMLFDTQIQFTLSINGKVIVILLLSVR